MFNPSNFLGSLQNRAGKCSMPVPTGRCCLSPPGLTIATETPSRVTSAIASMTWRPSSARCDRNHQGRALAHRTPRPQPCLSRHLVRSLSRGPRLCLGKKRHYSLPKEKRNVVLAKKWLSLRVIINECCVQWTKNNIL